MNRIFGHVYLGEPILSATCCFLVYSLWLYWHCL